MYLQSCRHVVRKADSSPLCPQAQQSPFLTVKWAVMALNALYPFHEAYVRGILKEMTLKNGLVSFSIRSTFYE